ncbi:DMT family transporter [Shewanella sp.]|uniref:DMT family transporter n=1 Tax=Shewanella sp. TaxID=50422 RepID=UPI0035668E6F
MDAVSLRTGLIYVTVAVLFWGMLPIALKLSAAFIDPVTLTWFRFLVALLVSLAVQWLGGRLRQFAMLGRRDWVMLLAASLLLMFNYVSFVYSLDYLAPGVAQLSFQTAPFFLAFGGVLFFAERLKTVQLACFALLALGMYCFFAPRLSFDGGTGELLLGLLIVQASALAWTSYALLQKALIPKLSPANVLLFIYGAGILVMAPLCDFSSFATMERGDWLVAIFCAINTLVAYGCFGQSMKYWPTAQVSAMLALTPVVSFTLTAIVVALNWWPGVFVSDSLTTLSFGGIALIVVAVAALQLLPKYLAAKEARALALSQASVQAAVAKESRQ